MSLARQAQPVRHVSNTEIDRPQVVTFTHAATSSVYIVQDESGRVKIGYASDPDQRIANLQCANSGDLRLIRLIDGGRPTERWLHKRFALQRLKGEWFSFVPEMMTVTPPDELPVVTRVYHEPVHSLGYAARFKVAADLGLTKPGMERTLLTYIVAAISDEETSELLVWLRSQP